MKNYYLLTNRLKNILFLCFLFVGIPAFSAPINTYSYSTSTGVALQTGPFTNLLGTFLDDDVSATTAIGFSFTYGGTAYTTFSATSNGLLMLGGSSVTNYNNVLSSLVGPYLAPYWDDNYTDANGNVQYKLMGVAGSRRLVVDYNLSYLGVTGTADKHFQIWLFETSNIVEFVYGSGNNSNGGFSVGILSNGASDYESVTVSTNTMSITTTNDNNTVWPGSGRAYIFNPVAGLPLSITAFDYQCLDEVVTLSWKTEVDQVVDHYVIEGSRDGSEYTELNTLYPTDQTSTEHSYNTGISRNLQIQLVRLKRVDSNGATETFGPFELACSSDAIKLYPVPTDKYINITCPENFREAQIELSDISGTTLFKEDFNFKNSAVFSLNLEDFPSGIYLLRISNEHEVSEQKIIKR